MWITLVDNAIRRELKRFAMEMLRYQINTESLVNNVVPRMSDQRRRAVNLLYTFD